MNEEMILNALRKVIDPDLHADIVSLGFIKNLALSDGRVSFAIELTTPACPAKDKLHEEAQQAVSAVPGVKEVDIKMTSKVTSTKDGRETKLLPDVKNIIPIASGKGGVGKSTVSVNIALALKKTGAAVGLLDADIYGPSVPQIMGVSYEPKAGKNDTILPAEHHGIKVMSMGFFTQQNQAVIWRGPMLGKMVEQFLGSVEWGSLDYLVIDLPPGTGDVQLTLCQSIPLTGAVIVSTPQDVALNVARRAILMFNKLNAPVIGIIENMSYYVCSHCGEKERIFGVGGVAKASMEFGIPFLGEIPLTKSIREKSDAGKPVIIFDPDSEETKVFTTISENLAAQISIQNLAEKKRK